METDRELLELAAKAAGIVVVYNPTKGKYFTTNKRERRFIPFDPLKSDGDALRLAVKLHFHFGRGLGNKVFCTSTYNDKPTVFESCERDGAQDEYAATRRAIVRAAAEIGRSM